jgi:hypothetical protein
MAQLEVGSVPICGSGCRFELWAISDRRVLLRWTRR